MARDYLVACAAAGPNAEQPEELRDMWYKGAVDALRRCGDPTLLVFASNLYDETVDPRIKESAFHIIKRNVLEDESASYIERVAALKFMDRVSGETDPELYKLQREAVKIVQSTQP